MSREDQSSFHISEPTSGRTLHNKTNLPSLEQTRSYFSNSAWFSGMLTRRFTRPVIAGLRENLRVRNDERCGGESTKKEVTRVTLCDA